MPILAYKANDFHTTFFSISALPIFVAMGWFHNWFGTKYYKLLYRHRDEKEAQTFLDKILDHLHLPEGASIVDVGCGQGRHSIYLANKGYNVTGLDVVEQNIKEARNNENEHLQFLVHDMRMPFPKLGFDLALNLFTSFGYFQTPEEDKATFKNIIDVLNPGGCFVFDFLNSFKVISNLLPEDRFQVEGVRFLIRKMIRNNIVIKDIYLTDGEERFHFQENVKLLTFEELEADLRLAGFHILKVFGNYELEAYDPENSDRLIIIAQRPA